VRNRELEARVRELTPLYGLGKVVTSATRQAELFSKLMEGSLFVTGAEMGWVLLQDEESEGLILRAQRNLPSILAGKLHQPWDDGVSTLVMLSGEPLAIHGEGLAKFKIARIGKAALIVPIKVRGQPIGVITVARQQAEPFNERNQAMLEAAADYASISLVNARLFQALEARAQQLQRLVDDTRSVMQTQKDWLYGVGQGIRTAQSQLIRLSTETKDSTAKAQMKLIARDLQALLGQLESQPRSGAEERLDTPTAPQG